MKQPINQEWEGFECINIPALDDSPASNRICSSRIWIRCLSSRDPLSKNAFDDIGVVGDDLPNSLVWWGELGIVSLVGGSSKWANECEVGLVDNCWNCIGSSMINDWGVGRDTTFGGLSRRCRAGCQRARPN